MRKSQRWTMSISNPNRFVTGLSDISCVKQVNRNQATKREDEVTIVAESTEPLVLKTPLTPKDRFVKDTFTPETAPDPEL